MRWHAAKEVAIKVGLVAALVGFVVGLIAMTVLGKTSAPFERGVALGIGLTPIVLDSAGVAYIVQARARDEVGARGPPPPRRGGICTL